MRSIPINRYPYGHAGCSFETVGTLKTAVEERQSRGALFECECECQLFNMKHAILLLAEESEPLAPFLSGSASNQVKSLTKLNCFPLRVGRLLNHSPAVVNDKTVPKPQPRQPDEIMA